MSQQYDFVAIGDILIDAFIQLNKNQADVSIDQDTGRKTLQMPFGSKLPYDNVVVYQPLEIHLMQRYRLTV
jgi:hypothetical protein